jgi:hypothetical protein
MKMPQNGFSPNMRSKTSITEWHRLPLVLIAVVSLLVAGCEKKKAVAAEITPPGKPQAVEPVAPAAAQPVAVPGAEASAEDRRVTAIFSANHADKSLDEKLPALEDFISSRITEKGFSVISREVATDTVSALLKDSKQTGIDQMLNSNASVLRLAQMLGANYILMATISTYDTDKQTTEAYGVKTVTVIYTLGVTYTIRDGVQAGTLAGDTFEESSTTRFTENSRIESTGIINRRSKLPRVRARR